MTARRCLMEAIRPAAISWFPADDVAARATQVP